MYRKILVGGATAAVVLGAGTAAMAVSGSDTTTNGAPASSTSSTSSTAPSASGAHKAGKAGKGHKGRKGGLLKRASHAQITVKTKDGYVTHDLINGTVTSVSASSISVQAGDKTTETFVVTKSTKIVARAATKGAKPTASSIGKIAKGDHVVVAGTGTSSKTAKHVVELAK